MNMNRNNLIHLSLFLTGIIVLLLFLVWYSSTRITTNNNYEELYNSLQDTLRTYKNKDSLNVGTTSTIQSNDAKFFLALKTKDKELLELQKLVRDYKDKLKKSGNSATKVETHTIVEEKFITIKDTINSIPTYTSNINLDNWVTGKIVTKPDSTEVNLSIKNEYGVIIGQEKQGLFKKPKTIVEVINYNPYTQVKKLKSLVISEPKKFNISIGPYVGLGVLSNGKLQPNIGIGLQYNLIKF